MPGYRPIVPLGNFDGGGLDLAGQGFNVKKLTRAASRAADIGLDLGGLAGYDMSKAMAVKRILDGGEMDGEGFGRGTQKKVKVAAKKAGHIGIGLVGKFGNEKQKAQVRKAAKVANGLDRAFSGGDVPGAKLRAMIARMPKH
jgi:hypothetical protein